MTNEVCCRVPFMWNSQTQNACIQDDWTNVYHEVPLKRALKNEGNTGGRHTHTRTKISHKNKTKHQHMTLYATTRLRWKCCSEGRLIKTNSSVHRGRTRRISCLEAGQEVTRRGRSVAELGTVFSMLPEWAMKEKYRMQRIKKRKLRHLWADTTSGFGMSDKTAGT